MSNVNMMISVDLNNVPQNLARAARQVSDFKIPLRQSAVYLEGSISRRFSSGGGSQGKWKRLSPATIRRHPHRAGGIPLSDTGRLKQSVTSGAVKQYTPKQLRYTLGANVKYAKVHNFGGGRIPARPFMYTDAKDRQEVVKIFTEFLRGVANQ